MTRFHHAIGIDYSGAATPVTRLPGLQVYASSGDRVFRVSPPVARSRVRNWTRAEVAAWLCERLQGGVPTIVGIDHGFSFPLSYFRRYRLRSWSQFLDDFVRHWPTSQPDACVAVLRRQRRPQRRTGAATELRVTERWTSGANSVFHFDVQGSVATSTHAGLPWLMSLRETVGTPLHVWPFDGWQVPEGQSVVCEVFPSLLRNRYARRGRTADQQDAFSIARWLRDLDRRDRLEHYLSPPLADHERAVAELEGWIPGVS